MIDQIKKEIFLNKSKFYIKDFNMEDIRISKFFHGSPVSNNKVIFFVSILNTPLCIMKIVRNKKFNLIIEREIAGMNYFIKNNILTPKIFFSGDISENRYVCEEILNAGPVGKSGEVHALKLVAEYHNNVKKGHKIKISEIISKVNNLGIKGDLEFNEAIGLLNAYSDNYLNFAPQHGDLTCRNIFVKGEKLLLIDLENFGLRSIWGSDITHYLSRIFNAHALNGIERAMLNFVENTREFRSNYALGISDSECRELFLIDFLFEVLQKNHPEIYTEVIGVMNDLWLE
jgi:thiamine kinase-like enzyme